MKAIIKSKIEELLSKEFYCSADELNGKSVVYSVNFNAKKPYIKILAYRNCVVICTSEDLYYKVRELVQSKNRDEIFELPLVYGQTIHYVPKGAVDFFLEHHSKDNILGDIKKGIVYLCFDALKNAVGTVTIKNNEICRLFVLPFYQNKGFVPCIAEPDPGIV